MGAAIAAGLSSCPVRLFLRLASRCLYVS